MSGGLQTAKPAVRRPLDGGVRRGQQHNTKPLDGETNKDSEELAILDNGSAYAAEDEADA
jgi:hypothetical protein